MVYEYGENNKRQIINIALSKESFYRDSCLYDTRKNNLVVLKRYNYVMIAFREVNYNRNGNVVEIKKR